MTKLNRVTPTQRIKDQDWDEKKNHWTFLLKRFSSPWPVLSSCMKKLSKLNEISSIVSIIFCSRHVRQFNKTPSSFIGTRNKDQWRSMDFHYPWSIKPEALSSTHQERGQCFTLEELSFLLSCDVACRSHTATLLVEGLCLMYRRLPLQRNFTVMFATILS